MLAWEKFLSSLENSLGKEVVARWLRTLKVVDFDAANLYLEAKDSFHLGWFEEHIREFAKTGLRNNNHRPIKVHFTLASQEPVSKESKKSKVWQPAFHLNGDEIDPHATFDLFIADKATQVSYELYQEIVYKKQLFNPIYLFGPPCSGKTHLLMAAAQALTKTNISCFFIRADTFTEHLVSAIRNGMMQKFRDLYRNYEVLLIDDIHLIAGKSASQEELFHTFNTLHSQGKQIILSGNAHPSHLTNIEPRLTSRFEWGITLPLQPIQNLELLLKRREEAYQIQLPEKTVHFLLSHFQNSTRSLIRALDALILRSHLDHIPIDALDPQKALTKLIEEENREKLSAVKIVQIVSGIYGIKPEDILGKSQTQECALPRQLAMYLCRKELNLPFTKIGQAFERDHSTVMSSVKAIETKIEKEEKEITSALTEAIEKIKLL